MLSVKALICGHLRASAAYSFATIKHYLTLQRWPVLTYPLVMRDLDRDFSMGPTAHRVKPSGRLWNPSADVYRSPEGWIVKVDLAGVCSEDLDVEISSSGLHIRGCRKDTFYRQDFICHQMEITYSRFEKTIQFPSPIEGASLVRDYRDGFLIIVLRSE